MCHIFRTRRRVLHTLILGLVALTFYAYYRTTFYDIRQFNLLHSINQSNAHENFHGQSNISVEAHSVVSIKNITQEASVSSQYSSHNASNPFTITTILSVSSSGQSSSIGMSPSLKQSSEQPIALQKVSNITNKVYNDNTAGMIYETGHTISVPEKCPNFGKQMDLMIIIMSAPIHVKARTAIRQTWGHFGQRRDIGIIFLLGITSDPKLETILEQEQAIYGDIARGKFMDSYSNLTLKTISALEWTNTYCNQVKFLLKTDDDMFINVQRLLTFIKIHYKDKNVIFGRLAKKWKPVRNKKSKYYVSPTQFKQIVFPDFTTGPAYLLSSDIIQRLYEAALDQTYLKLEDVFVTGIIAHKLGIQRIHANEFLNKRVSYSPCNIQQGISIHMVKYSEQFDLWKKLLDGKTKCK